MSRCRDGLVRFSLEDIGRALQNFKKSGATYLLSTTFVEVKMNTDIRNPSAASLIEKPADFQLLRSITNPGTDLDLVPSCHNL